MADIGYQTADVDGLTVFTGRPEHLTRPRCCFCTTSLEAAPTWAVPQGCSSRWEGASRRPYR
jgi:hypothetical protein